MRRADGGVLDVRAVNGRLVDFRVGNGRVLDLGGADGRVGNLRLGHSRVFDVRRLNLAVADVGGMDDALVNLRRTDGRVLDLRGANGRVGDLGRGDGGVRNLRRADGRILDFGRADSRILDFRAVDGSVGNLRVRDGRVPDVRRFNGGHLHLQRPHRAVLQLPRAHGVHRQLRAGDAPGGELAAGNGVALDGVRHLAQRHLRVALQQAVVGVLRHAHGHRYADFPGNHAHRVAQIDVLESGVLRELHGVFGADEVHRHSHVRQVTPAVVLLPRRLSHQLIALGDGLFVVLVVAFLCLGHVEVNPLRVDVLVDIRTVDVQFRQIDGLAVLVLAGGHDARDHARLIHVVGHAQKVFALANLHVRVPPDALHQKHIPPVPRQLRLVLLYKAVVVQKRVYRVDMLKDHLFGGRVDVRIEGEAVLGQAGFG